MLADAWNILLRVILPLVLVVGVGYFARRRMKIDLATLVTLNLYFFVPSYLLSRLTQTSIDRLEVWQIGIGTVLPVVTGSLILASLLAMFRMPREAMANFVVGSFFYNSANFGIPVAELALGPHAGRQQAIVVMFTSMMMFLMGYAIVAAGQGNGWSAGRKFLRMPFIYVAILAMTLQWLQWHPPEEVRHGLDILAMGMLPIALLTLGAQISEHASITQWRKVSAVVAIKLVCAPLLALLIVRGLGLWPDPGRLLVLAAAAPTAVNTVIVTLDLGGDADFATDCVFWSTVMGAFSVACWIAWLGPTPG